MLPTEVLVTFVNVTVLLPSADWFRPMVATAVEPTVSVTVIGLGGAALSDTDTVVWRSRPTVASPMLIDGAMTVAVIVRKFAAVLKPAGVTTAISEVPDAAGLKAVDLEPSPPLNVSGEVVIEPTPG